MTLDTTMKSYGKTMCRTAAVMLVASAMGAQLSAQASGFIARFEGAIGVVPVSNGAGPANADGTLQNARLNVVKGVNPGAGPWRIADLRADIDGFGNIKVRGRGLLLASGNGIGTNANQSVFATLICEAAAPFVERSTLSVPLDANGDFRIVDTLDSVPSECPGPVLLIRNTGGVWFAAGIPKLGDD
jgi:hypothetical protein